MSKTYKVQGALTIWVEVDIDAEDEDEAYSRAEELRFDSYTNGSLGINSCDDWCGDIELNFEEIEWDGPTLVKEGDH